MIPRPLQICSYLCNTPVTGPASACACPNVSLCDREAYHCRNGSDAEAGSARAGAVPLRALTSAESTLSGKTRAGRPTLSYPQLWRGSPFDMQVSWNLTPIKRSVRHITLHPHLKRSATIRRVNCVGMPSAPTNSSDAPVSDWLRMRQAIVRPLNSMLADFKMLPFQLGIS